MAVNLSSTMPVPIDSKDAPWPLIDSPAPIITILAAYLYFVLNLGPKLMSSRKPMILKKTIMAYNFVQVIISFWLVYVGYKAESFDRFFNPKCEVCLSQRESHYYEVKRATWWYMISKLTELLDTVFFVLRKKQNQVSYLHVHHHTVMPLLSWINLRFYAGDEFFVIPGSINSAVHIAMYSYYFLAGLGPHIKKYLWWKKYLTALQLIQFAFILLQVTGLVVFGCNYSKVLVTLCLANVSVFMYFFLDFYKKSYRVKQE